MFARFLALVATLHLAFAGSVSAGELQNSYSTTRHVGPENTQLSQCPEVITQTVAGVVSGDLDIGDILEGAAFAGLGAGLSATINLGELVGASPDSLLGIPAKGDAFAILSPGALLDGFGDSLVSASLGVIQNGGSFGDALASSFGSFLASQSMAAFQNGIGDLTLKGLEEGSLGHALLHGTVGCAFAEISGGDCRAGFAAGAAQALYAGYLDGSGPISDQQALNTAEMIGAFAGSVFSGGKGENVSAAASIAQSGMSNNYLAHDEWSIYLDGLGECGNDEACKRAMHQWAENRSLANEHEFLLCQQNGNCDQIAAAIKKAEEFRSRFGEGSELVQRIQNTAYYGAVNKPWTYANRHVGLLSDLGLMGDVVLADGRLVYSRFNELLCGGLSNADCVRAFEIVDTIRSNADGQAQLSGFALALLAAGTAATGCGAAIGCLLVGAGGAYEADQLETALDNGRSTGAVEDANFVQALVSAGLDPETARAAHFWTGVGLGVADIAVLAVNAPKTAARLRAMPESAANDVVHRTGTISNRSNVRLSATEAQAAESLRKLGYDVEVLERNLGASAGRTPEFLVSGMGRVDVYTPEVPTSRSIASAVEKKVTGGLATTVIVVVPRGFSKIEMYYTAARVFGKPTLTGRLDRLYFDTGSGLTMFDPSVIRNMGP